MSNYVKLLTYKLATYKLITELQFLYLLFKFFDIDKPPEYACEPDIRYFIDMLQLFCNHIAN